MNVVYLLLGANLGDRRRQLSHAIGEIKQHIGVVVKCSSVYETEAWGVDGQPSYFNQVLMVETALKPRELLASTQGIENRLGRTRTKKWESRVIDIDILFYNEQIIEEESLTIPHPLLHRRKFTLLPLTELTKELMHPVLRKTVGQLLLELEDPLEVKRLDDVEEN